ncbi:MAG: hypothetical protein LBB23_00085 [Rickettsiales bacterium]|nr:hypothetical protein [Rickettsiales bacterium]
MRVGGCDYNKSRPTPALRATPPQEGNLFCIIQFEIPACAGMTAPFGAVLTLLPLPRPPTLRYGATPLRQRRGLLCDCIRRRGLLCD